MALCYKCMRYLVFVFNFLYWLIGLSIVAIAIWLRVDSRVQDEIRAIEQQVNIAVYVILGIGVVMTVLGFLGCCGAYQESKCLLGTFFACLLIIFLAEVAGGVYIYIIRPDARQYASETFQVFTKMYTADNATVRGYIDFLQESMKCCGASNASYEYRAYIKSYNRLPLSCCQLNVPICQVANAYKDCVSRANELLNISWIPVVATGAGLLFIELLGMIFAMSLCCYLRYRKHDEYDEEEPFETEHLMF